MGYKTTHELLRRTPVSRNGYSDGLYGHSVRPRQIPRPPGVVAMREISASGTTWLMTDPRMSTASSRGRTTHRHGRTAAVGTSENNLQLPRFPCSLGTVSTHGTKTSSTTMPVTVQNNRLAATIATSPEVTALVTSTRRSRRRRRGRCRWGRRGRWSPGVRRPRRPPRGPVQSCSRAGR